MLERAAEHGELLAQFKVPDVRQGSGGRGELFQVVGLGKGSLAYKVRNYI